MADTPKKEIIDEFESVVNMTSHQLHSWLQSEASQSVGQKETETDEATGHASGRRIVELLQMHRADYSEADLSHMQKVIGYVHRHRAQRPSGDLENTRWRYSLMNWGHDPLKG